MRKLAAGVCALLATTSLSVAAHAQGKPETLFVQAGRLLADPATGKV